MAEENDKKIIEKVKEIYDKFVQNLGNLRVRERDVVKKYKEHDRQEKIEEITKSLNK
ncbi:MAG: hypothetical protein US50_C0020G0003 [Candidatus Nomurabacteria bacterium GW2011_GWB1_37_5]|uniref:Uncharacterized protein n=1 Tax=Candidatus Nomurabacteria bacterium GW2011_GWB1_37_5 TaxID=1618742 RepID=A0A0G0JEP2_9BACT|nr:MAG: hypothetical protein US50_C0020G0003 [Candidatus Nomurabacteria bacterium GW2011_GWB1_37_5]